MSMTDYKAMARMAVEHDAYGFLKNHGTTKISTEESLLPTAMDLFRNDDEYVGKIRLYEAVKKFSDVLVGNYTNNTAVRAANTTAEYVNFIVKIYNLLVVLKNNHKLNQYKQVVDVLKNVNILIRNIPGNVDYMKLAAMLSEVYLNIVLELGCERCERALTTTESDSEEQ